MEFKPIIIYCGRFHTQEKVFLSKLKFLVIEKLYPLYMVHVKYQKTNIICVP